MFKSRMIYVQSTMRRGVKSTEGFGCLIFILGIILSTVAAIWFGFVFMLVGGIVQFVNAVIADPVSVAGVAFSILRVVFCWTGFFVFGIGAAISAAVGLKLSD